MEIISLEKAKQLKLKRYFTGIPCKFGHTDERTVSSRCCIECTREKSKNRDFKSLYQNNKEKESIRHKKSRSASDKPLLLQKESEYRKANKQKIKENSAKYYEANKTIIRKKMKIRRSANVEKERQRLRKWKRDNKQKVNFDTAKRRARKLNATPKWANLDKIKEVYLNCPQGYEVDHIIPLRGALVSGLHVENNLQYLTPIENQQKNNSFYIPSV